MAEISLVNAFLQAAEMIVAGENRKATEATRIIVESLERNKDSQKISRTIRVSRNNKKAFSY
jgi:hypothetical protein